MNEKENIERELLNGYRIGQPCKEHTGCLCHTTHPCEGCGRIAGGVFVDTSKAIDIIFQERQAKKELVEALEDALNDLERKLQYAKNNAMRRWWNIENNLLRDILNKHKEKE
jgi:hypothetical protein